MKSAAAVDHVGPSATHPVTPDGRYFVVRGRLWRRRDPRLSDKEAGVLVQALMQARRAMRGKTRGDAANAPLRERIDEIKRALGERGDVWWDDGVPDFNRRLVKNTPYAGWYEALHGTIATTEW